MSATRTLTGARWSSAVRCPVKAQHEALGTPHESNPPPWMENAFARGFHVGEAWAMIQAAALEADGKTVERELAVPWGPPELEWRGHVDLADMTDRIVYEAFHSKDRDFRPEKARQAAGYADSLGDEWRAVLVAINATDVQADGGFAIRPYPVNVEGLRGEVRDIKRRVVTAVEAGAWNPADRISDTPKHPECAACPFSSVCHANYQPPHPSEIVGLETKFEELRITESDLHHAEAAAKLVKERRDGLRDQVREFLPAGQVVECGGTTIKRTEVAGRLSVKLGDYLKAGFEVPDELDAFVSEGKPSERWKVDSTGGTA